MSLESGEQRRFNTLKATVPDDEIEIDFAYSECILEYVKFEIRNDCTRSSTTFLKISSLRSSMIISAAVAK